MVRFMVYGFVPSQRPSVYDGKGSSRNIRRFFEDEWLADRYAKHIVESDQALVAWVEEEKVEL